MTNVPSVEDRYQSSSRLGPVHIPDLCGTVCISRTGPRQLHINAKTGGARWAPKNPIVCVCLELPIVQDQLKT
jgi:hypothetical protein